MIKIIETNLSIDENNIIKDHQSRVIEVDSWDEYVQEIKGSKSVVRSSFLGNIHGTSISHNAKVVNLTHDDFHLDCDIVNGLGIRSRKLAFWIR